MNYTSAIYWLTRLDSIRTFLTAIFVIGIIGLSFYYLFMVLSSDFKKEGMKSFNAKFKGTKIWMLCFFFIGGLGLIFIPNTKQAVFIVAAGKTLDYFSKDTAIKKIPKQLTGVTSEWLENKMRQLEEDVKQKAGVEE
jgi:hypothetical protein